MMQFDISQDVLEKVAGQKFTVGGNKARNEISCKVPYEHKRVNWPRS